MKLIEEIKKALELEIRMSPDIELRFEAVFQKKQLDVLLALLGKNVGNPAKALGARVKISREARKIVDQMGGIRPEQSFYLRKESDDEYLYIALWPWQSDPSKITLKIVKSQFQES